MRIPFMRTNYRIERCEPWASIKRRRRVCNGTWHIACLAILCATIAGCQDDEKAVEEKKAAAEAKKAKKKDPRDAMKLPVSPMELFRYVPDQLPKGIAVSPGATVKTLRTLRPKLATSAYSKNYLVDERKSGPFSTIHYQLDRTKTRVTGVLATFRDAYNTKPRRDALVESIQVRLGKPKQFNDSIYQGHRWKLIDYRLDLRSDKKDGSLELLMHSRGRFDPTMPDPDGISRTNR
ncbi:MAG: hypothetical protein VX589_16185 [Myxococcota bacterium]|nr:hypothetical protein [Myxococcota bacterium]